MKPKIIIVPGNGDSHIETDNWYAWVRDELVKQGYEVIARDMPDPVQAKASIWLPFIEQQLRGEENSIIIGHSSGGVAALRYLETHKLVGIIIAGVNYIDLGAPEEKISGYYDHAWQWDKIESNAGWIEQFASLDDPYIPIEEARYIHNQINSTYHEYKDRGHFMPAHNPLNSTFPEIINLINSHNQVKEK